MPDFITSVVSVVLMLGVMILVHEWGHFIAAKAFGVRVLVFSIGFGPRLWGRTRGATDYRVSALPLGGYVKMAGDNPAEERSGTPDEFLSRPRWQRALIVVAGPVMNVVMALALIAAIFLFVGIPHPAHLDLPPVIRGVAKDSAAARAGLQAGDRILELNGRPTPTWEACQAALRSVPAGGAVRLLVERAPGRLELALPWAPPEDPYGTLGFPQMRAVIDSVAPGMPADRAGIKPGDEVVAVNGRPIGVWPEFVEAIRTSRGEPQQLVVRRGDAEVSLEVRPVQSDASTWRIGVVNRVEWAYRRPGLVAAVGEAARVNGSLSRQILGVVAHLFVGKASIREMQGVIGIARESGQAAKKGPTELAQLTAVISLNLAILNLLPIPILDGGHILLLAIEGIRRRDLSLKVKERIVQVGLVFLLFIFVIVMYNDVVRLLPHR